MARDMEQCRRCRRAGTKLFLKGERCFTPKCAVERRPYAPGDHGQGRQARKKVSDYGVQLREKQKLRRIYIVGERQFRNCFERASKRKGVTGEALMQYLERRLDNVIYRLGLVSSRTQARELVRHGHFAVNGQVVDVPSYVVKVGDVVTPAEKSRGLQPISHALSLSRRPPEWLALEAETMQGRVLSLPTRDQIDTQINEQAVVNYYSR